MNQALKSRIEQPTHPVAPMSSRTPTRSSGSGPLPGRDGGPIGPGRRWWWQPGGCSRRRGGPSPCGAWPSSWASRPFPLQAPARQGRARGRHHRHRPGGGGGQVRAGRRRRDDWRRCGRGGGGDFGACGGVPGVCTGASSSLPVDAQRPLPRRHLPAGVEDRAAARCCGLPGVGRGLERCRRSPMAWSCSSSTSGSRPTPTSTRPGRLVSRRSRRADLSLVWSPCPAWIG